MRRLRWMGFIILLWASCWASPPNLSAAASETKLRIASFNIQVFGQSKISKALVAQTLVQILDRYDLVFIQEIRDNDNTAIYQLLEQLNAKSEKTYSIEISARLGRTMSKEQYAFIYRTDHIKVLDVRTFEDANDDFEREPFIGHFKAGELEFSLIGIHVTPREVKKELLALNEVYRDVSQGYDNGNVIVMGDMNADCDYYNDQQGFQYFDEDAHELIPAGTDTTVAPPVCTYDRALAFGDLVSRASGGGAFDFREAYNLRSEIAREISDHYPIEFSLSLQ